MNNFNDQQQEIISTPAIGRLIVKAGPGTGKTWSLIERIKFLVKEEGLDPATEILVLSFSVAAVQEVKKRLMIAVDQEGYDDDLLFVSIRTFDSFSSYFMYLLDSEVNLDELDYKQRISRAIEIIKNNPVAHNRLLKLQHFMVDEVQDLVGIRAELTLAILKVIGGGYTLFGDPAQAVYNFTMGEENIGLTSDEFLEKVQLLPCGKPKEIVLSKNFRIGENKKLGDFAEKGRRYLVEGNSRQAYDFLRRTFVDLPSVGTLGNLELPSDFPYNKTAFLCSTNGQALLLAGTLKSHDIPFHIRRPLEVNDIPFWIGAVFARWTSQIVRKKEFEDAFTKLQDGLFSPEFIEDAWSELKVASSARSSFQVTQLRQALLEKGVITCDPRKNSPDINVISTIHRSKGREFDNVVLLMSQKTVSEKILDEARIMFVGLTRAKNGLYRLSEAGTRGICKILDRWIRTSSNNRQIRMTAIEVGAPFDIDKHSPVSLEMFENDNDYIDENQCFLMENIRGGEDVRLEYYKKENGVPKYLIKIRERENWIAVANTSTQFGKSMKHCLFEIRGMRPSKWPIRIDGLWVREVVAEIGNLGNKDVPRCYRTSGIWLGVRIDGFGYCREWGEI